MAMPSERNSVSSPSSSRPGPRSGQHFTELGADVVLAGDQALGDGELELAGLVAE